MRGTRRISISCGGQKIRILGAMWPSNSEQGPYFFVPSGTLRCLTSTMRLSASLLAAFLPFALGAIELFSTTRELVLDAPYVSHVSVLRGQSLGGVLEYELLVHENYKKQLPDQIRVRIPVMAEMGTQHGVEPAGVEWIVMLGQEKNGLYPLRSIAWGRIPVVADGPGEKRLAKNVTGMGGGQLQGISMTLGEFRSAVRDLLRTK